MGPRTEKGPGSRLHEAPTFRSTPELCLGCLSRFLQEFLQALGGRSSPLGELTQPYESNQ
jgi:hypothetical protein